MFKSKSMGSKVNQWRDAMGCNSFFFFFFFSRKLVTNTAQMIWERFADHSSWAHALHKDKECDIFSLPVLSDKQ